MRPSCDTLQALGISFTTDRLAARATRAQGAPRAADYADAPAYIQARLRSFRPRAGRRCCARQAHRLLRPVAIRALSVFPLSGWTRTASLRMKGATRRLGLGRPGAHYTTIAVCDLSLSKLYPRTRNARASLYFPFQAVPIQLGRGYSP